MASDNVTFTLLPSSSNNDSIEPLSHAPLFSPAFQILAYFLYNLIFLLALIGNSLVLIVLLCGSGSGRRNSSPNATTFRPTTLTSASAPSGGSRGSVTNLLIAHLALADLLLALFCVPFSYISILLQYWPFGSALCTVLAFAQPICVFLSAYTLVLLALDRYLAILHPLRPHLSRGQLGKGVVGVWIFSILLATPLGIFTRTWEIEKGLPRCEETGWPSEELAVVYTFVLLGLQYFLPVTVLGFTYTRIALEIWRRKRNRMEERETMVTVRNERKSLREARLERATIKTIYILITVVALYTLAWLPLNILHILFLLYPNLAEAKFTPHVYIVAHFFAMSHTTFNPLIYAGMNDNFQKGLSQLLRRIWNFFSCSKTSRTGTRSSVCSQKTGERSTGTEATNVLSTCVEN